MSLQGKEFSLNTARVATAPMGKAMDTEYWAQSQPISHLRPQEGHQMHLC
jgi:hypothetical protein